MFMAFFFKKVGFCKVIVSLIICVWELMSLSFINNFNSETEHLIIFCNPFAKEGMFPIKSSQQWVNVWMYRELNEFCFVIPEIEWKLNLLWSHCMVLLFYGICWSACEQMFTGNSEKQVVHCHTGYARSGNVSVCVDLLESVKCGCWGI